MRGIEPLIAVIILVAVTIVIAIAVVGYIMGWWGATMTVEQIRLFPDSKLRIGQGVATVELHVKNEGTATAVIYKVEIEGINSNTADVTLTVGNETTTTVTISIPQGKQMVPGATYKVNVYTKAGNVFSIVLRAE